MNFGQIFKKAKKNSYNSENVHPTQTAHVVYPNRRDSENSLHTM